MTTKPRITKYFRKTNILRDAKLQIQEAQQILGMINTKITIPRNIIVKLLI